MYALDANIVKSGNEYQMSMLGSPFSDSRFTERSSLYVVMHGSFYVSAYRNSGGMIVSVNTLPGV